MAELDAELLERVARWCAEAGRQAGAGEIRAALAPLGWDELLAVRALLADPPPARPLGPQALADLARGTPADVAAERERAGRYRREDAEPAGAPEAPAADGRGAEVARRARGARRPAPAAVVVRRARDRAPAPAPAQASPPLLDELRLPGGRAVLERLVRRHGGRRAVIAAALAAGWRRADGGEMGEDELAALLELHGMARAFQRREHDELLHALRAAGGVRSRAAERVGLDVARLEAALHRAGAEREAERIREDRRAELRARATLTERVHLLLEDPGRLADLGLLEELEADLRARLPEHLRALRTGPAPVGATFAASLSLEGNAAAALAERFGLDLGAAPGGARAPRRDRPEHPRGPREDRGGRPGPGARPGPGGRSFAGGPGGRARPGGGSGPGGRSFAGGPGGQARPGGRSGPGGSGPGGRPFAGGPGGQARPGGRSGLGGSGPGGRPFAGGPGGQARPGGRSGPGGRPSTGGTGWRTGPGGRPLADRGGGRARGPGGPRTGAPSGGISSGGTRPAFSRPRSSWPSSDDRPRRTAGPTERGVPRTRPPGERPSATRGAPGARPAPRPGRRPPPRGRGPRKP